MSRPPTVSVVVIFYDDERFLPEAIESVFGQTYTDWELVLVDDGSTDGSSGIARGWAARHPDRVRYVAHDGHANRGPAAARNLGSRHARGEYLATLDSDDVWKPEKLTEQVAIMQRDPTIGMVVGATLYWWSWADDPPRADRVRPVGAPPDQLHQPPALTKHLYPLGDGVAPATCSWLVRRDVVSRVGGWEEELTRFYEDQYFLAKVYLEYPVWVSSRCWDLYRHREGSMVRSADAAVYHEARRTFLAWYEELLVRRGIDDPALWRLLRRATWPYRHPRLAAARRAAGLLKARLRR